MKYAAILILGFIAGYFIYPTINTQTPIQNKLSAEDNSKFQNFIDQEARNYALAQDAQAKLKAAEEMYGKMMVLFLANLGLKVGYEVQPVAITENEIQETNNETPQASVETTVGQNIETAPTTANTTATPKADEEKKKPLTPEARYKAYRTSPYVDEFKGKAKRMIGRFEGSLTRAANEGQRVDTILMEFNLEQVGKTLTGNTLVLMTDPSGKEYSRNAGNGGNRAMRSVEGNPDQFYVDASPTSYFFIDLKNYPSVVGEYFERDKSLGLVWLRKMNH